MTTLAKEKKKKKKDTNLDKNKVTFTLKPLIGGVYEDIQRVGIKIFNEETIGRYGCNILVYRMLPDVRDGLKPIHRRLLYSAYHVANGRKVKCNGIIGELLKKWHPHGDVAAYSSMTKMTQSWRGIPLITGKGNFGSVNDPDGYAAMRYTEAYISDFAKDCFFSDFMSKDDTAITDFIPNFDDSELEPFYLPAKYPTFLFNWNTGVAQAFQNEAPGFSFTDALETTIKLIKEGPMAPVDINLEDPQGCDILAERGVKGKFFDTPDFKVKVRSKYSVKTHKGKNYLQITTLPFETSVTSIDASLKKLITEKKKINYIEDTDDVVKNYKDMEYSIFLARGYDPHTCMEDLFKKTALEKTFSLSMQFTNDLQLIDYGTYRNALNAWIDYRRNQVKRRCKLNRARLSKEIHIREAFIWLIDNDKVDQFVVIMRNNNSEKAKVKLEKQFGFSGLQAEAVSNLRFSSINPDNRDKYVKEVDKYRKEAEELFKIIHSDKKVDKVIIQELEEGLKKYGGEPNRSKIHLIGGAIVKSTTTNLEVYEKHFLKFSKDNVKSINQDIPFFKGVVPHTFILGFNKKGNFANINISKLRDSKNNSVGYEFEKHGLSGKCVAVVPEERNGSLLLLTKNGTIQRSDVSKYNESKTGSAIKLSDGDKLVDVIFAEKGDEVFIITNLGNALLLPVKDISETNRNTKGVTAIKLKEDEYCIGISRITKHQNQIITITDRGDAKRFDKLTLPKSKRADKGFSILSASDKGKLIKVVGCTKDETLMLYTNFNNEVVEIPTADVKKVTRMSQGKKIISMPKSVKLVDARIK